MTPPLHPLLRAWQAARLNYTRRGAYLVLRDAIRKGKPLDRVAAEQHAMAEGVFL
jgi:hypothetical protein